jgi:hypothetical protein
LRVPHKIWRDGDALLFSGPHLYLGGTKPQRLVVTAFPWPVKPSPEPESSIRVRWTSPDSDIPGIQVDVLLGPWLASRSHHTTWCPLVGVGRAEWSHRAAHTHWTRSQDASMPLCSHARAVSSCSRPQPDTRPSHRLPIARRCCGTVSWASGRTAPLRVRGKGMRPPAPRPHAHMRALDAFPISLVDTRLTRCAKAGDNRAR